MRMPRSAAIYCRISQDGAGDRLGVQRQEKDCREYCARRGWAVADVLVDNDVSAYSGKPRPAYTRLSDGLRDRSYDGVVVWHPDRLHRSPAELETFIDLVEKTGAAVATVTAGDYDLSSPEGRLTARIVGSVARKESEDKSRRLRRKHVELAEAGRVSGGGPRPFGYERDRLTISEPEAALIRDAAKRLMAGEPVRSIVRDWTDRGVPTVTGAHWTTTTVKRLMTSARISGQREHKGTIVGPAIWPAIIDPDQTVRLRTVLSDPTRKTHRGTARSYLLTGFMVCECGVRMTTQPVYRKGHKYERYVCSKDRGGCGRCGIIASGVDRLVVEAVLIRLDSPKLAQALAAPTDQPDPMIEVERLEARQVELAEMFGAGELTRVELAAAKNTVDARLATARASLVVDTERSASAELVGQGSALRERWSLPDDDLSALSLDQKRAVIATVVESVTVARTTRANNKFDPDRIDVVWR
jgi:site-specific DNA recombinase